MPEKQKNLDNRMNIFALTWPIFIEILLRNAIGASDIFMLSGYSDDAVSAVGVISQISFFLIVVSMMVSSGTSILISQYNGAARYNDATNTGVASVVLAFLMGAILSLGAFLSAPIITASYGLEVHIEAFAYQYLIISGSFTIFVTLGIVFSTILRSHGYSRSPMLINLFAGVINIIGNYTALYQPFGLPVYGLQGVAISTVFSQIVSASLLWLMIRNKNIELPMAKYLSVPASFYKKILRIGVFNAGEILSYNMAQLVIVYFVVQMGTAALTAFTYGQTITRLSFSFAVSIGLASQIQTSYFVGKGWIDSILARVQKYFITAFFASIVVTSTIYLLRFEIIGLFTTDPEVVMLIAGLMLGSILLEAGRVFNLVFISSLKGAGDISFPVKVGVVSMWGIGAGLTYLLGIHFGMGVLGAWLAMAADEWTRGIIMLFRWRSKKWSQFSVS